MRNLDLPGRSPVRSMHGMACTSQPLATMVAIDILKAGGNALDAAIAACAMQCVVEPQSTGIGGDCFAMYAKEGKGVPVAFNGSGKAPAGATLSALQTMGVTELERASPHSVIVPGAVDAWYQLHGEYGHMPMKELLQPAIDTAFKGYPLSSRVVTDIAAQRDYIRDFDITASIYLDEGNTPIEGFVLKLDALGRSLEQMAEEGRDAFYKGELAAETVEELQRRGGLHTLADFSAAKGDFVNPISTTYQGCTVYECPPNGQGIIALLMINMFEHLGHAKKIGSSERMHLELEACRLAYATRDRYLADKDQSPVPIEALLSKSFAKKLVGQISVEKATTQPAPKPAVEHQDTVYISVVDSNRNACSFINTLFWSFGSGITTRHGITLTNRGQGFNLEEGHPNCIAPNKRPLHTIIPGIATKGDRVELSFGVMGGEYQAMGHAQFLHRYLAAGHDIQEAMDAPRCMVNPFTGEVELESGTDADTRKALGALGHVLAKNCQPIGGSQAIAIDWEQGTLTGGSDHRKDGCAIGY